MSSYPACAMVSLVEGRRSCTSCSGRRSSREREAHLKEAWSSSHPWLCSETTSIPFSHLRRAGVPPLEGYRCPYSLGCREGEFSEIGALVCACSLLSLGKQFSANSYLLGVSSSTEGKYSSLKVSKGLKEPSRVVRKE